MRYLTLDWPDALSFFDGVIGLHDSEVIDVKIDRESKLGYIILINVLDYSIEQGFRVKFDRIIIEMADVSTDHDEVASVLVGYDLVDAELKDGSLWMSTMVGSVLFRFKTIRFLLPD